jgi:ribosomal protein L11 methyltransferase
MTLPCNREQGEAVGGAAGVDGFGDPAPVLVADEPDADRPDEWVIHAYFEQRPTAEQQAAVSALGSGEARLEELGESDWVTMSQSGLQPLRAGRFHVHTPMHKPESDLVNFEIDAGLAFGTGQHATTAGCLEVLDALQKGGARFRNIADIGTGTGLLAFAALALWPDARCLATDIDPVAIDVACDNAAINRIALGHGAGELLLVPADGMDLPMIAARAPFDLIIANILAGPLIELAPDFARALTPGGTVILAGLLGSQAAAVTHAFETSGLSPTGQSRGEWPVLSFEAAR